MSHKDKKILNARAHCGTWAYYKSKCPASKFSRIKIKDFPVQETLKIEFFSGGYSPLTIINISYAVSEKWLEENLTEYKQTWQAYPDCAEALKYAPPSMLESARHVAEKALKGTTTNATGAKTEAKYDEDSVDFDFLKKRLDN